MNDEIRKLLEDCLGLTIDVLRECEDEKPELADKAAALLVRLRDSLNPPDAN